MHIYIEVIKKKYKRRKNRKGVNDYIHAINKINIKLFSLKEQRAQQRHFSCLFMVGILFGI